MFIISWSDVLSGECNSGTHEKPHKTKEEAIIDILNEIEDNYKDHLGEDYNPDDYRTQLENTNKVHFEIMYAGGPNKYNWFIKELNFANMGGKRIG